MIGKKMRRMPFAIIGNTWLQFPKISVMPWTKTGTRWKTAITLYQQAWKRIKKIKEEGFFRGDIPTKSFPVEKKDTLALRHAK